MESIERLRSYAEIHWEPWDASRERLNESLDDIEQEIAERYIELPVDAEGVPIRVGDKMEREGQQFIVCAVAPAVIYSRTAGQKLGEGFNTVGYRPEDCRHPKPRTIEDVLTDFANEVARQGHQIGLTCHELTMRYAEEIRGMMA